MREGPVFSRVAVSLPAFLEISLIIFAFLWGAIWGSFLNVVIWRLPRGENLAHPASACPKCGSAIRWYDNVPVLGWMWLRGKCRDCKAPISPRYPFVELLVGLLGLGLWLHITADGRLTTDTLGACASLFMLRFYFVAGLVAIAFIDLDLTLIPDKLSHPLIAWGFAAALLSPKAGVWEGYFPNADLVDAGIGFAIGFGMLFAVFGGYKLLKGVDGGGGGDLWLLGAIGANLGWQAIVFVLFAASVQGLVVALSASLFDRVRGREAGDDGSFLIKGAHTEEYWERHPLADPPAEPAPPPEGEPDAQNEPEEDPGFGKLAVPFGPFLALAAVEFIFIGEPALRWATSGFLPY